MASVSSRISQIKQPRGGYINPSTMKKMAINDNKTLSENENIFPGLIGTAVDYLTRYVLTGDKETSFEISLTGARMIGKTELASSLLSKMTGLDDVSIISACKLVGFDVCYRSGPIGYKPVEEILPNNETINNIRIMVERTVAFLNANKPIIKCGFSFDGAYTSSISVGDADYLTVNGLWDVKTSKNTPKIKDTLQILIYYLMGLRTPIKEIKNIQVLGLFNPRMNIVFYVKISDISNETIKTVEEEVIGYNDSLDVNGLSKDEYLTVTDLTRLIGCSRYQVMKYYSEDGLPLIKDKNKYVISESDYYEWLNDYIERRKQLHFYYTMCLLIVLAVMLIFIIAVCF